MNEYEARCALCGGRNEQNWMEEINTGRAVHWLCPKCFKEGARQADHVTKNGAVTLRDGRRKEGTNERGKADYRRDSETAA